MEFEARSYTHSPSDLNITIIEPWEFSWTDIVSQCKVYYVILFLIWNKNF